MKRMLTTFFVGGLTLGVCAASFAITLPPQASIIVDGVFHDFTSLLTADKDNNYSIPAGSLLNINGPSGTTSDGTIITFGANSKYDPSLTYSFSVTNNTGSIQSYTYNLAVPILPTLAGGTTINSVSGSVTDDISGNGVSVNTTPGNSFLQVATGNGIPLGIDVGLPYTGFGGGPLFSYNIPPGFKTGTSAFIITSLDVHLNFTLTPGGDAASFTGAVGVTGPSVTAVPEPGTIALLVGAGLPFAVGLRRSRRNRK